MENMIFSILSHILFYPVLCLKIFVAHIALEGWSRLKMQIKKFIFPFLSEFRSIKFSATKYTYT